MGKLEAAVRWALLFLGSLVFLFCMLVDLGFLFSQVSVWPGTWIYVVVAAAEVGILMLTAYLTVARHASRS